jgi:hypothetical protein
MSSLDTLPEHYKEHPLVDPHDIELPDIPVHKTKTSHFDPTAVVWDPPKKSQPGKVIFDPTIQRVFREAHKKKISDGWNISLANPVHLSVRSDNTKAIMDGAHTTAAAKENGVKSLPSIEHMGLDLKQEAAFHLKVQSDRKADSANDKWMLKIRAGIPAYVQTEKMLARYGLAVGTHIRAAGAVIYVVENFGPSVMEQVVQTMNAWCNGKPGRDDWDQAVIRALGYLFGHHPLVADPGQLGRKLQKKSTPPAMRGQIASMAKGGGGTGSRTKIGAKIVADIWNVRRAPANQFPMSVLGVVEPEDEDEEDEE